MRRLLSLGAVLLCAAPAFAQVSPCPNGTCPTARPSYVVQPYGFAASQVSYGVPSYGSTLPAGVEIRDVVGRGPTLVKVGVGGAPDVFLDGPTTAPAACSGGTCPATAPQFISAPFSGGAVDALDEVNAARARRGLPPFARDDSLTQGAAGCAQARASRLMEGHTTSDVAFLPPGTACSATGCAAWHPSLGWGSCATYEPYRTAGAAWVMGADGRRYMSLFVR